MISVIIITFFQTGMWWWKDLGDWNGFVFSEFVWVRETNLNIQVNLMTAKNCNSTRPNILLGGTDAVECRQDNSWAYKGASTWTYKV